MKSVAFLGGTFDPVHNGHVQSALELKQRLSLDKLYLLPCHIPPHRQLPGVDSRHRLAMVELAVAGSGLLVDDRELQRNKPSYTVDTLQLLRKELGDNTSLVWVMGSDAFALLDSWYRWRELLDLAHIVVMARPGEQRPLQPAVAELLRAHQATSMAQLQQQPAGLIWLESLTPYPVSATSIRQALADNAPVDHLLPAAVLNYIQHHQLYRG